MATGLATPTNTAHAAKQRAGESRSTLFNSLFLDTGCAVMVYDAAGTIVCANARADAILSTNGPIAEKRLHDVLPGAIAEERLIAAARVFESGEPAVIDGMIGGRMLRGTLRALEGESPADRRVIEVLRPVAADAPKPDGLYYVRARNDDEGVIRTLTAREREVLEHIGRGLSTAEIAESLGRSTKTVEWHRVSLGSKLGIANRVELARIAIRAGLTSLED